MKFSPILVRLIFFVNLFLSNNAYSQCFWATQSGGVGEDYGIAIGTDSIGNVYSVGIFNGTADFDPSASVSQLTSNGGRDIYLLKLDFNRNFVWVKNIGGVFDDEPKDIFVDKNGDLFLTGFFRSSVDFDPSNNSSIVNSLGSKDVFLAKYDSAGLFEWANGFGGTGDDEGNSISIDGSGGLYVAGSFQANVDFDPGTPNFNLISNGGTDVFVSKFRTSGLFDWSVNFGGTSDDVGRCIKTDVFGNVYLTGYFQGTVDFNPGTQIQTGVSNGVFDCFISKFDSTANLLWSKQIGGNQSDGGNSLDVDNLGNVYCTGFFSGPTDFDPGSPVVLLTPPSGSVGYPDIFVLKLNNIGTLSWAGRMGGITVDVGADLVCNSDGDCYLTGRFSGLSDFDLGSGIFNLTAPSLTAGLYTDAFVCKIQSSGSFSWAKRLGGKQHDWGNGIVLDKYDNVLTTGYFTGLAGFDPNALTFPSGLTMTSVGSYDSYISKIYQNKILQQPQNSTVNIGSTAIFTVLSSPYASYQWQIKNGNSFLNLSNSSQFSGVQSNCLVVNNIDTTNNLQQFRCVVGSTGCSDTSIVATLTVGLSSGTLSNVQESIVRVYPIPVNKILNIQLRNDKINIPFALIDCLGNLVLQGQLINHENVIDLSEVAAGIYTFIVDGRQSFPIAITAE